MMKLLAEGPSPFVRKVRLVIGMKGLDDSVQVVATDDPQIEALRARNPLGKIPILLSDDGDAIYDSHVICEYLDSLSPSPALFPRSGAERYKTLTLGALGDGVLEAALLLVYEGRYRPEEMRVQSWVDMQQRKIDQALALLEADPPKWSGSPDYGHLTLAAALGYLDFRHAGRWRESHPKLVEWLNGFAAAVPAFEQTTPRA